MPWHGCSTRAAHEPVGSRRRATDLRPAWRAHGLPPGAVAGAAVVALIVLLALAAPWITPDDPLAQHLGARLEAPPSTICVHRRAGRDLLSRCCTAPRNTRAGRAGGALHGAAGTHVGIVAGFCGGWIDRLLSGLINLVMAFPASFWRWPSWACWDGIDQRGTRADPHGMAGLCAPGARGDAGAAPQRLHRAAQMQGIEVCGCSGVMSCLRVCHHAGPPGTGPGLDHPVGGGPGIPGPWHPAADPEWE